MSAEIDYRAYAAELLGQARTAAAGALKNAEGLQQHLAALELDVAATLAALADADDAGVQATLLADLRFVLPARRKAIVSEAASRLSSDGQAALDEALEVTARAVVALAKAFLKP